MFLIVVTPNPDASNPFWQKMESQEEVENISQVSKRRSFDSGLGSSLSCTPKDVPVCVPVEGQGQVKQHVQKQLIDLDLSRESGELSEPDDREDGEIDMESEENDDGQDVVEQLKISTAPLAATGNTIVAENGYITGCEYVARSLAERMVLDQPPAPEIDTKNLEKTPNAHATLITDRVGKFLTRIDKVIHMQNAVARDFWQLAKRIATEEVNVDFRIVFINIGLDWCLTANKQLVKEGLKQVMCGINRVTNGRAIVGVIGVTPIYEKYQETKVKTVTYNQYLGDAVKDYRGAGHVEYLLLHRHFLDENGEFVSPITRYFDRASQFTLAGGLVLREALLKTVGVIPMDGNH